LQPAGGMSTSRTVSALLLALTLGAAAAAAETQDDIPWQDLFSVRVLADSSAYPGSDLRFRIQAYSPYYLQPRAGVGIMATLELEVLETGEVTEIRAEAMGRTDALGEWTGTFSIPPNTVRGSSGTLEVEARAGAQERKAETWVTILAPRAFLSTDKALYRPGERLRARVLWAGRGSLPAGTPVRFELLDERNRRVLEDECKTSSHRIAHVAWQLPATLTPGWYRLRTRADGLEFQASRRVRVAPFERAPFSVIVEPVAPFFSPGEKVEVRVEVRTLLGTPVPGAEVELAVERWPYFAWRSRETDEAPGIVARGVTGEDGQAMLSPDLDKDWQRLIEDWEDTSFISYAPYRDIDLVATARHPVSARQERASGTVRLSYEPIHLYAVGWPPSAGDPLYVTTFSADGEARACRVAVTVRRREDGEALATGELATNRFGAGSVDLGSLIGDLQRTGSVLIELEARGPRGETGHRVLSSWLDDDPPDLVIDSPRVLLDPAEPVRVTLRPRRPLGRVLVELQQGGSVLGSRVVESLDGPMELELDLEAAVGPVVVAAYPLDPPEEDSYDDPVLAHRPLLVLSGERTPELHLETDAAGYRPGATARLRMTLTGGGRGASAHAAIGVAAVDRAVELRQQQERLAHGPALLEPLREERPRTVGEWSLQRIASLQPEEVPAGLEAVAAVLLNDLGPDVPSQDTGSPIGESYQKYRGDFERQLAPLTEALKAALRGHAPNAPTDTEGLMAVLRDHGVDPEALTDPWGTRYRYQVDTWDDQRVARALSAGRDGRWDTVDDFTAWSHRWKYFQPVGRHLNWLLQGRLMAGELIRDRTALERELRARGIDLATLTDPWGEPYHFRLVSGGGKYGWDVWSTRGRADCEIPDRWSWLSCGLRVWSSRVDYGEVLNRAMEKSVHRAIRPLLGEGGGSQRMLPGLEVLQDSLEEALRFPWLDPWGRGFRIEVTETVRYTDLTVRQTGTDGEGFLESKPVLAHDLVVLALTDGPDGETGTEDDRTVTRWYIPIRWSDESGEDERVALGVVGEGEGVLAAQVIDSEGAPLPGVRVQLTGLGLGQKVQFTDAEGGCSLPLPAGTYRLVANLSGFSTVEYEEVPIRAGRTTWIEITLSPAVEEVITVTSEAPLIAPLPRSRPNRRERPPIATPRVRTEFPDTLFWLPEVLTDEEGSAWVDISLADTITTWSVAALASTSDGQVVAGELDLPVAQPFFIEPDPPQTVTAGDRLDLPVYVTNFTDGPLDLAVDLTLLPTAAPDRAQATPSAETTARRALQAPRGQEVRVDLPTTFRDTGTMDVEVGAAGGGVADAVLKRVEVRPDGRQEVAIERRLIRGRGAGAWEPIEIVVPDSALEGTAELEVTAYPDLRSHLVAAAAGLSRRPTGCTEQVISASYPSLLLLRLASDTPQPSPELLPRDRDHVRTAVEHLRAVQRPGGGFPYWARSERPDVALTAYGLGFLVSAEETLRTGDETTSDPMPATLRAAGWLARTQGADGLWHDDRQGPRAPEESRRTTAVAAEALARFGRRLAAGSPADGTEGFRALVSASVGRALDALEAPAESGHDPYLTAVYGLAAHAHGEPERLRRAAAHLRALTVDGPSGVFWELRTNTPFAGWGASGRTETTALAVRALLAEQAELVPGGTAEQGLSHLLREHGGFGLWGSTQATIQALQALAAGLPSAPAQTARTAGEPVGSAAGLQFRFDGVDLGPPAPGSDRFGPRRISQDHQDALRGLSSGRHRLEIRSGGSDWTLVQATVRYAAPWDAPSPSSAPAEGLVFERHCGPADVSVGQPVRCWVRAGRRSLRGLGMLIAEIGLPPGAQVDRDELEREVDRGRGLDHYQIRPDRVVLYLWPRARVLELTVPFTPRFAADAQSVRSVLYDYYNPDERTVLRPERFRIGATARPAEPSQPTSL